MENKLTCPLCKIPMIIVEGARKNQSSTRYPTIKSQVFCKKCGNSLKEAMRIHQKTIENK